MRVRRATPSRGFTLVEVMIALTLMLGIATALWKTMSLTFETKSRMTSVNERFHEGRQAMARITRELRMAYLRSDVPEEHRIDDPTFKTEFKGESDEIHFASTAHLRIRAGARESDQAEMAYFLKSGRGQAYRGKTLFRRESKRVDARPERGGTIWPVVAGVKEFKLEYWDDSKEVGDDAWRRDWDSEEDDLLPARVRVTLVLEPPNGEGPDIRFVSQSAIKIRRPINVIEAHAGGDGRAGREIRRRREQREKAMEAARGAVGLPAKDGDE
jgi:general secretion pathway protein J